jgi:hypothetical protein
MLINVVPNTGDKVQIITIERGNVFSVCVFFSTGGYFLVCDDGRGSCGMWAVNLFNKVQSLPPPDPPRPQFF